MGLNKFEIILQQQHYELTTFFYKHYLWLTFWGYLKTMKKGDTNGISLSIWVSDWITAAGKPWMILNHHSPNG